MTIEQEINVSLDGFSDFNIFNGTGNWSEPGWLSQASFYQADPDKFVRVYIDLSGSDWGIRSLSSGASGDGLFYLSDVDDQDGRNIQLVSVSVSSIVNLRTTHVGAFFGFGPSNDISLGNASSQFIHLQGQTNTFRMDAGFVMTIDTSNDSVIDIGDGGGVGSIFTGYGGSAQVTLGDGTYVDYIQVSGADSSITFNGQADVTSIRLDGGNLSVGSGWVQSVVSHGGQAHVSVGAGGGISSLKAASSVGEAQTVENAGYIRTIMLGKGDDVVMSSGEIGTADLGDGNNYLEATGYISTIVSYDGDDVIILHDSDVEQINVSGGNNRITTGSGWVGYIDANHGDDVIIVGSGGAQQINAERGNNVITTSSGWVTTITTDDGEDVITIGTGGVHAVQTGSGNDIVRLLGWAGAVQTGEGDDSIILENGLGWQGGPIYISGGDGADKIVFKPQDDLNTSVIIDGGYGEGADTLDLSALSNDVTLSLGVAERAWQNMGSGYVVLAGVDNIIGGSGNDNLRGASIGGAKNNELRGGGGDDTLSGGDGDDTLIGGGGQGGSYGLGAATSSQIGGDYQQSALIADVTGDGLADVVMSGQLFVVPGNGGNEFSTAYTITHSAGYQQIVTPADFNGDGAIDLLTQTSSGWPSYFQVLLNDGAGRFATGAIISTPSAGRVIAGDLNDDGRADVVVLDSVGQTVKIYYASGEGGVFSAPISVATGGVDEIAKIVDWDGDGSSEVVLVDTTTGDATLITLNGDGDERINLPSFGTAIGTFGSASAGLALADLDGDGRSDVVIGRTDGTVDIYRNEADGSLSLTAQMHLAAGVRVVQIEIADLNGDGINDILTLSGEPFDGDSTLSVFEGRQDGTFADERVLDTRSHGGQFALGDLNGDAILDVARTAWGSGSIVVMHGKVEAVQDDDVLNGEDGDDDLQGLDGQDRLYGGLGNDNNYGGAGNDSIYGGAGEDWLHYEAGDDYYDGGADFDRADYRDAPGSVVINLATGRVLDGGGGRDTLVNVERVTGSAFEDWLIGNDGELNSFSGELGDDLIDGGGGWDYVWYGRATGAVSVDLASGVVSGAEGADTLISIEGLGGSNFSDTLLGSAADNWIEPDMEGDSGTLNEAVGGNDLVDGRGGFDTIVYWRAVSGIFADLRNGTVIDGLGNTDTLISIEAIDGSDYSDVIISGTGSDSLSGRDGDDTLTGNEGNDTLIGGNGDDSLLGGAGNDVLSGGLGSNILVGGINDDTYIVDSDTDTIIETLEGGKDTVRASVSMVLATNLENLILLGSAAINGRGNTLNNIILGNTAANLLVGGGGNDTLMGDAGDDTLEGAAGNDSLVGGDGSDTASYASAQTAVTISLLKTTAQNTFGAGTDTLTAIENLIGSASSDVLTGNAANNFFMGGSGNDKLSGDAGNDTLDGGIGNDSLTGGAGIDTASYASAQAAITVNLGLTTAQNTVGAGIDTLTTIENLTGSDAGDTLTGSTLANRINGGLGNDTITGGAGIDSLDGGAGSDVYVVALMADKAGAEISDSGLLGTDELRFTGTVAGTLVIAAGDLGLEQVTIGTGTGTTAILTGTTALKVNAVAAANGLTIVGNAGTNTLSGSAFADRIDGGAGSDTLVGGGGDDTLIGGLGNDSLTGGLGADDFLFSFQPNFSTNMDRITDYNPALDDIWLAKAAMAGLGAVGVMSGDAFWSAANAVKGHDATDRIIYNTATGALYYDEDGSSAAKAAVQIAQLSANLSMTAADFFIF